MTGMEQFSLSAWGVPEPHGGLIAVSNDVMKQLRQHRTRQRYPVMSELLRSTNEVVTSHGLESLKWGEILILTEVGWTQAGKLEQEGYNPDLTNIFERLERHCESKFVEEYRPGVDELGMFVLPGNKGVVVRETHLVEQLGYSKEMMRLGFSESWVGIAMELAHEMLHREVLPMGVNDPDLLEVAKNIFIKDQLDFYAQAGVDKAVIDKAMHEWLEVVGGAELAVVGSIVNLTKEGKLCGRVGYDLNEVMVEVFLLSPIEQDLMLKLHGGDERLVLVNRLGLALNKGKVRGLNDTITSQALLQLPELMRAFGLEKEDLWDVYKRGLLPSMLVATGNESLLVTDAK